MKANSLDKNPRYDSFEQMLQSCKEEYCRQKYDAESVEKVIIDNIILKRKKSRTKRLISIMVAVALVLSSSIVISKSFLSDTGVSFSAFFGDRTVAIFEKTVRAFSGD